MHVGANRGVMAGITSGFCVVLTGVNCIYIIINTANPHLHVKNSLYEFTRVPQACLERLTVRVWAVHVHVDLPHERALPKLSHNLCKQHSRLKVDCPEI